MRMRTQKESLAISRSQDTSAAICVHVHKDGYRCQQCGMSWTPAILSLPCFPRYVG